MALVSLCSGPLDGYSMLSTPVAVKSTVFISQALLNNPTSLTVTPDGVLYIADMGNLRVHSVVTMLPEAKHGRYR